MNFLLFFRIKIIFFCFFLSFFAALFAQNCNWQNSPTGRESSPRPFFAYTPEPARPFFKTQDYLSAQVSLLQDKTGIFLRIVLIINEIEIAQELGNLEKNGEICLENFHNQKIYLPAAKTSAALVSETQTRYDCLFRISKKNYKRLKKYELNSLRINWAKAYQDYEIYEVDCLRRLLNCL